MSGRSAILTYHSLDDSGSVISVGLSRFTEQMDFLAQSGTEVVALAEVAKRPGSVALTFDDGFQNFAQHAMPVLQKHGFPATVFVVSGYCGRHNDWDNRTHPIPRLPLLNWKELGALPPEISIGAHTVTHRHLSLLSEDDAMNELRACRQDIEQRLGRRVEQLAYPYGASSPRVRELARSQFASAVGTSLAFLTPGVDPMDLPRIDTYYLRSEKAFRMLFSPVGRPYVFVRHLLRRVRGRLVRP